MASSRKKQDDKNLKTIREFGSLPQNKYCFDCNQRGPTYVNVTIGSFVCTKCSGMLRGLTPPHRVKSISMATFANEEIDLLKNRGNEYCKNVWLGLYDRQQTITEISDEQLIRDFMVDKYEKKRYYLDPSQVLKNGITKSVIQQTVNDVKTTTKPLSALISDSKPIKLLNGNSNYNNTELRKRPEISNKSNSFTAKFNNADIFFSTTNSNNNLNSTTNNKQEGFANFDDNPVFNNANSASILGMPTPATLVDNMTTNQSNKLTAAPPPEDRYAALKDLDNALKSQNSVDWNSSGSNGSLYSSPTPTSLMYSSPSPHSLLFGSPSQGQFMNAFQLQANQDNNTTSNPFNNSNNNGQGMNWVNSFNPFRDPVKNGFNQTCQPNFPPVGTNGQWTLNPFKVGNGTMNSTNNPFL